MNVYLHLVKVQTSTTCHFPDLCFRVHEVDPHLCKLLHGPFLIMITSAIPFIPCPDMSLVSYIQGIQDV